VWPLLLLVLLLAPLALLILLVLVLARQLLSLVLQCSTCRLSSWKGLLRGSW
jgi:hypothetical protein